MTKTLNRRAMLSGATTLPMLALPALAVAAAPETIAKLLPSGAELLPALANCPAIRDPLYLAILQYQLGMDMFGLVNEADWHIVGGEDAVIEGTYGPPLAVLSNWDQPAICYAGAIEALQFVTEECKWFSSSPMIEPMVEAVLGFLRNAQQSLMSGEVNTDKSV